MTLETNVNFLAVIACAIMAMAISYFWYSPFLLGKMWLDSMEKSEEEVSKDIKPLKTYGISFLAYFILAYSISRIMIYINATTVTEGMRIGFLCWFGFILTTMTINALLEGKSLTLVLVDGGYYLIIFLVFGIVLGAWQ
ncbi:MAG: DUF1761 domain-containing protein [Bacteroidota bacterium]